MMRRSSGRLFFIIIIYFPPFFLRNISRITDEDLEIV